MRTLQDKRLVIFGCGYIGSAVATAAMEAGAQVETLTRNAAKAAALRGCGVHRAVVAELASSSWHDQIDSAPDFVINCVSSGGGAGGYQRSYVDGIRSIVEWAKKSAQPIGTFVYTSSTSVYPQGGGSVVEESMTASGATPNGAIIRESEMLLQGAGAAVCGRWFILRLAGIYGPHRHHLLDQLRTDVTMLGGSGAHRLNLAHRDDIVTALLATLTAPAEIRDEIFNVSDHNPALRADVVRWLAGRLNRLMPRFDGVAGARRGGEPMPDRIISSGKIQRMLHWQPQYADYQAGFGQIFRSSPELLLSVPPNDAEAKA